MDISEVKQNLGRRVQVRDDRLMLDGEYILTGCIIRRDDKFGFYYQVELTKDHAVTITGIGNITAIDPAPPEKTVSRHSANIASDMLEGYRNRLFITDNPDEIPLLYSGALFQLRQIVDYARGRLAKKEGGSG